MMELKIRVNFSLQSAEHKNVARPLLPEMIESLFLLFEEKAFIRERNSTSKVKERNKSTQNRRGAKRNRCARRRRDQEP